MLTLGVNWPLGAFIAVREKNQRMNPLVGPLSRSEDGRAEDGCDPICWSLIKETHK